MRTTIKFLALGAAASLVFGIVLPALYQTQAGAILAGVGAAAPWPQAAAYSLVLLCAGLLGRLAVFQTLMKKETALRSALLFGIGWGCMDLVYSITIAMAVAIQLGAPLFIGILWRVAASVGMAAFSVLAFAAIRQKRYPLLVAAAGISLAMDITEYIVYYARGGVDYMFGAALSIVLSAGLAFMAARVYKA